MQPLDQYLEQAQRYSVVPVTTKLLADHHTPVSLLQRFYKGQEDVFLLESVEGGEKWGRYTFLGIDAHAFVEIDEELVISNKGIRGTVPVPKVFGKVGQCK